jgi:4-hydroxy-2-oxoheptanedioate aldolase
MVLEMHESIVRKKLAKKEPVFCFKTLYQDPALVEMIGLFGFDCMWICNEHVGIDPSKMESMIRACRASGIDAMIRTKPGTYKDLLHPLEMGASGIMLPRVKSAGEVRQVVKDMKFYPRGRRGIDGVNADAGFGLMDFKNYLEFANDNNFLLAQIEDPEVVDHIEEIAEIDDVDILFVGPGDLSTGMGIPGEVDHPEIVKVCERVAAACLKNGKAAGMACSNLGMVEKYLDMGFLFLSGGSDYKMMRTALFDLREKIIDLGFQVRDTGFNLD